MTTLEEERMYSVMRYSLEEGRSTAELYDTFDCSQWQANEMAKVLRGMKDGFWYYATDTPTVPKWHENGVGPHYYTDPALHAIEGGEVSEIASAVTALLAQ